MQRFEVGEVLLFPGSLSRDRSEMLLGLVITAYRHPHDVKMGDELIILCGDTRYSVPAAWCERIESESSQI